MTVGAQPTALSLQLDAAPSAAAPGVPAGDPFGGLVAALAVLAVKPTATGDVALPSPEAPTLPAQPAAEADPEAADQLIALGCGLPAPAQLLVRKPGPTVAAQAAEADAAEDELEEQPARCGLEPATILPIGNPIAPPPVSSPPVTPTPIAQAAIATGLPAHLVQTGKAEASPTPVLVKSAPAQPEIAAKAMPIAPEIARSMQAPKADPVQDALRAVLAQVAPGAKHQSARPTAATPLAPELKPTALFTPAPFLAPELARRGDLAVTTPLPIEPDTGELIIERQLDLAGGDEWLDQLTNDIARSAGDTPLRFRLNPENLGSLRVEIANDRGGTAVRLTTDTETARAIIAEAQPRLIAEARAQGLRISEAHVDLGQQPGSDANRRHADGTHEPQLRTARSVQDEGERDGKPTRAKSERYA